MIHPAASVGGAGKWIAHAMDDLAFTEILRLYFPDFLEAEAVGLGLGVAAQVELFYHLLCKIAVTPLRKESDPRVKLHAPLKAGFGLATLGNAQVIGRDAFHAAVSAVEDFARRKARVDFYTHFFCALTKPFRKLIERYYVVAMVVHLWRGGDGNGGAFGEEAHLVLGSKRGILELIGIVIREPIREKLINGGGLNDISRQYVVPNLSGLLQKQDPEILIAGLVCELL